MRRVAFLSSDVSFGCRESMARTAVALRRSDVETAVFSRSEDLVGFSPDCVLAWSVQDPKLTGFPTYGLLAPPVERYTRTRRFVRNVLTYDAILTTAREVETWVGDIAFGARKFACPVARFAATVQATEFEPPRTAAPRLTLVRASAAATPWQPVLERLAAERLVELRGPAGAWASSALADRRRPVPFDGWSVLEAYREAGMGLDLVPPDAAADPLPSARLLEIVASGAVALTTRHPAIERIFGDTVLYLDPDPDPAVVARQVRDLIGSVRARPDRAVEAARAAHAIFLERFAIDTLLPNLEDLHERVLQTKGYRPDPDPAYEDSLPTATYIMRTGGGRPMHLVRRALDSVVAQQYPKLAVLLVLFRPMPEVEQLRREYPTLGLRTVEDYGGLRSTAICAGMRAVETDLFGLLDDDDVLNPNHVRMLVKALEHHGGRGWRGPAQMAYSGSIELHESEPRSEQVEYEDELALVRDERRVMEHYRLYSSVEMSRHRWYLINSWLARRSLIDEELLDDPRIHSCEDLYVALLIAQRTFLAFSGEVTMNHCYRNQSSTLVDAHRHLDDTLRGALRNWTRQFPTEHGYAQELMPLGRPAGELVPPADGVNLVGRLDARPADRRAAGAVRLDDAGGSPLEVRTIPTRIDSGAHRLRIEILASRGQPLPSFSVGVEATGGEDGVLAEACFGPDDLERRGELARASLTVAVGTRADGHAASVTVRIRRAPRETLEIRRLMLETQDQPIDSSRTAAVQTRPSTPTDATAIRPSAA